MRNHLLLACAITCGCLALLCGATLIGTGDRIDVASLTAEAMDTIRGSYPGHPQQVDIDCENSNIVEGSGYVAGIDCPATGKTPCLVCADDTPYPNADQAEQQSPGLFDPQIVTCGTRKYGTCNGAGNCNASQPGGTCNNIAEFLAELPE